MGRTGVERGGGVDWKEWKCGGRVGVEDRTGGAISNALWEDFVVREEDNVLDFLLRHDAHRTLDL